MACWKRLHQQPSFLAQKVRKKGTFESSTPDSQIPLFNMLVKLSLYYPCDTSLQFLNLQHKTLLHLNVSANFQVVILG
jgi:hypothetical protein